MDISVGQGYTSKIYKTSIFVNDQKDPVYICVMKIPSMDCINELVDKMYTDEEQAQVLFYELCTGKELEIRPQTLSINFFIFSYM